MCFRIIEGCFSFEWVVLSWEIIVFRWAPTSYITPTSRVITLVIHVFSAICTGSITPFITRRGPPCSKLDVSLPEVTSTKPFSDKPAPRNSPLSPATMLQVIFNTFWLLLGRLKKIDGRMIKDGWIFLFNTNTNLAWWPSKLKKLKERHHVFLTLCVLSTLLLRQLLW